MDVVRLTKDLVNIPSETERDGEKKVAEHVSRLLAELGIESETTEFAPGRANVVASIGKGEGLMLNGHLDTVPLGSASEWRYGVKAAEKGGRIYGRGTSDMKGGVACIISALSAANLRNPKRRILLTFVAGEEKELEGSSYLLSKRKGLFRKVRYGVVAEATDMGIQTAQKGYTDMTVVFRGRAAHASKPWQGDSAILKASRFIGEYTKLMAGPRRRDPVLGESTANIGRISGGTAVNVVPDYCEVQVDRRIIPGETPSVAVAQARKLLKKLNIGATVRLNAGRGAFRLSESSGVIRLVSDATGAARLLSGPTGYTEVELYKAKAGIDSVVFGPGNREVIHQSNEYIKTENLLRYTTMIGNVISKWLG